MTIRIGSGEELYTKLVSEGEWGDPDDVDKDLDDFGYYKITLEDGTEAYVDEDDKATFDDDDDDYSECPCCGMRMIENPNNDDIECMCI